MTLREASSEAQRRCGMTEQEIAESAAGSDAVCGSRSIAQTFRVIKPGWEEYVIKRFVQLQRFEIIPDFEKIISLTMEPENN